MKAVLFIIVYVAVFTCEAHGHRPRRYVGGNEARLEQFPYLASLRRVTSDKHFCGGSIIHQQYVLTAAHCLEDTSPNDFYVAAGANFEYFWSVRQWVDRFSIHENYDTDKMFNDIALIKLKKPLILRHFKKISLPALASELPAGVTMTTAGFGRTHYNASLSKTLQYSNVTSISLKQCTGMMSKVNLQYNITNTNICTFDPHKGFCKGDSGGPLVYHGKQVGIVSWMIGTCARGYPDVYVKVAPYVKWIERNMDVEKWDKNSIISKYDRMYTSTRIDKSGDW